MGVLQVHVQPPPTPLIKIEHDDNLDKGFVKLGLRRDQTSEKSKLYKFKFSFFKNGEPKQFLLLVRNFNITLA